MPTFPRKELDSERTLPRGLSQGKRLAKENSWYYVV